MRALSAAYDCNVPCQSRWSCVMLSTTAALGSKPCTPCSWKLESSSTHTSGRNSNTGAVGGGGASCSGASAASSSGAGVLSSSSAGAPTSASIGSAATSSMGGAASSADGSLCGAGS